MNDKPFAPCFYKHINLQIMKRLQTVVSRIFASDNSDYDARSAQAADGETHERVFTPLPPIAMLSCSLCFHLRNFCRSNAPPLSKSDIAHHLNIVIGVRGSETNSGFA